MFQSLYVELMRIYTAIKSNNKSNNIDILIFKSNSGRIKIFFPTTLGYIQIDSTNFNLKFIIINYFFHYKTYKDNNNSWILYDKCNIKGAYKNSPEYWICINNTNYKYNLCSHPCQYEVEITAVET